MDDLKQLSDQMAQPSTPMTGSGGRRQLVQADGESSLPTYIVPATPGQLAEESQSTHPILQLRRRLDPQFGRRSY